MSKIDELKQYIRNTLGQAQQRVTPAELFRKALTHVPGTVRGQVKKALAEMVAAGQLVYTQHYSISHVEMAHPASLPVRFGAGLGPAPIDGKARNQETRILLSQGASFGAGDHPTTRLSMRGMAMALELIAGKEDLATLWALDIGTGSGVLAIAAAKLGIGRVMAVDNDPVACHEARANVALNNLQQQITVIEGSLENVHSESYNLILANLRPPTLVTFMPSMQSLTAVNGVWILSGFRPEGAQDVAACLPVGFQTIWQATEGNWTAIVAKRKARA